MKGRVFRDDLRLVTVNADLSPRAEPLLKDLFLFLHAFRVHSLRCLETDPAVATITKRFGRGGSAAAQRDLCPALGWNFRTCSVVELNTAFYEIRAIWCCSNDYV